MANTTHIVKAGENLTGIANQYNTTVNAIAELNNIKNVNLIYVGQELIISGEAKKVTSYAKMVTITAFGLQADTTRTVFITWEWDKEDKIEGYYVHWTWYTSDGQSFWDGNTSLNDPDYKLSVFNAPENAVKVKVTVNPVSKTEEVNGTKTKLIDTQTSTAKEYSFNDNPPEMPDLPEIYIEGNQITLELNNIDVNASHIEFRIIKGDDPNTYKSQSISIITNKVKWTVTVDRDAVYRAQCRAVRLDKTSDWTEYTAEVSSLPTTPHIDEINVLDETTIRFTWTKVNSTKKYKVQYVARTDSNASLTPLECFEDLNSNAQTKDIEIDTEDKELQATSTISNLSTGTEYYIRMCAVPTSSTSTIYEWSDYKSFIIGTVPTAPTTWSSSTSAVVGDLLKFYWMHNSEDGSNSTSARLYLTIGDTNVLVLFTFLKEYNYVAEFKSSKLNMKAYKVDPTKPEDHTYVCEIDSTQDLLANGATIQWSVSTAGVLEDQYGDISATKKMDVYIQPTLNLNLTDEAGTSLEEDLTSTTGSYPRILESFPFNVVTSVNSTTNQAPTGYYISIAANSSYNTVDSLGREKYIIKDTVVYSKYIDTANTSITEVISAGDVTLENNIEYTLTCSVAMNSNLKATATAIIRVGWEGEEYEPIAQIGINNDDLSAIIRPYINGEGDAEMDVYRREYDGSFTKINSTPILDDGSNTFITDPHPALDFARYRITARSKSTGKVSYSDSPLVTVGEKGVVIQWDETWTTFTAGEGEVLANPTWAGSMLKLRYNIDISTNTTKDGTLVDYIGRKHPVSYYGTQIGESQTWNLEIPKTDKETLYAIRRLAAWMGDVYVREPSGVGYWASITVSYSQTHRRVTIPVTFNITRVEGGV